VLASDSELIDDAPETSKDRSRKELGHLLGDRGGRLGDIYRRLTQREQSQRAPVDADNKSKSPEARKQEQKKDAIWDATMDVMRKYPIEYVDKSKGEIRTERTRVDSFDPTGEHAYVIAVNVNSYNRSVTVTVTSSTDTKARRDELAQKIKTDIMDENDIRVDE
jgi:hypothetical protein